MANDLDFLAAGCACAAPSLRLAHALVGIPKPWPFTEVSSRRATRMSILSAWAALGRGVSVSRTLAMLREESRLYRQAAAEESTTEIKSRLVNHALALALLAERI